MSGRLVEASSFDLPPPPVPPPVPSPKPPLQQAETRSTPAAQPKLLSASTSTSTSTSASADTDAGVAGQGAGGQEDESRAGRLEQLRQLLGGSDPQLARLAKLDAAARGSGTTETAAAAEAADPALAASFGDSTVGGSATDTEGVGADGVVRIPAGADKAARARVHRAVQETFPFVKVIDHIDRIQHVLSSSEPKWAPHKGGRDVRLGVRRRGETDPCSLCDVPRIRVRSP